MNLMKSKRLRYIIVVLAIIVIVLLSNIMLNNMKVRSVEIQIEYPSKDQVLDKTKLQQQLTLHFGNFTQLKRKEIHTQLIQQYLQQQNFVSHAHVSVTIGGILKILVQQSLPVIRIFDTKGHTYYIDDELNILQLNTERCTNTIIATTPYLPTNPTKIDSIKDRNLYLLYQLATLINQDSILKYQISQIYQNKNSLILVPQIGSHTITLSSQPPWDTQLHKLSALYQQAFLYNGWDNYSNLNPQPYNQVVCTKKTIEQ